MPVRLRQICLVGQDLDYSVGLLTTLLDTTVAYRDPGVVPAFGGMFNALLFVGDDCFLEVVSPTDRAYEKNTASVRSMRKNQGDCGYMVSGQSARICQSILFHELIACTWLASSVRS